MRVLLLRLTSLGNVAMTVPVVASLSARYPDDEFIVVAKKNLSAMFYGMANVHYHEVTQDTSSAFGLRALYRALVPYRAEVVVDLQDSTETRLLRTLLRTQGARVHAIDYGRMSKHLLTWRGHTRSEALPTEFERYSAVLKSAGLETDEAFSGLPVNEDARLAVLSRWGEKEGRWIGIAPFAKSKTNMLPYKVTKQLIHHYANEKDTRVFLFGAGKIETEMLQHWASITENVVSVAGMLPLEQELELMRRLDVMICMDSANQHLSSLVGLRAVSVWCGTHPKMGFYGWKQQDSDRVEIDDLPCRPCTAHGCSRCRRSDFACREIKAKTIVAKVQKP